MHAPYILSADDLGHFSGICRKMCLCVFSLAACKARKKDNKLNFSWPKMAHLGPPFRPPRNSPEKSLCGSLCCVLSQELRHMNFFLGFQTGAFWAGGQKVYVEKVYLEDRNLLKLRRLDSSCPFFLSDNSIWGDNELKGPKCYDRKAKIVFRTSKCCNR